MTTPTTSAHAARRSPTTPTEPVDLPALGGDLLTEAAGLAAGRTARTLTPGAGSPLKQTVMALRAGAHLQEHVTPGPASLLVLDGEVALLVGSDRQELEKGTWLSIPREAHELEAVTDAVALITVVADPS
jgi:quercetin dioxygenase-like cupin family protein